MNQRSDNLHLSDRAKALKASTTLAVTAKVGRMKAKGIDVIGFGAGQPDFDTPANIKQAAIDALLAGKTKYTPTPGIPEAREVVAEKLRIENNIQCQAEDVVITTGAKQALYMALQCTVNPGDAVILLTPCWVSYPPMVELTGARVIEIPASLENDFKVTPEQLDAAVTSGTTAIILNSPSNPCGIMYSESELRALVEVLARYSKITIIADEIYEKIIFGGIDHFSVGSIEEIADRTITINGLSKAYAMTGWRIGYMCAPGNPGAGHNGVVAIAAAKMQSQMTSNITSFNYAALIEALTKNSDSVEEMRKIFAIRAKKMHGLVTAMPDMPCPVPTGAFYLFPDISAHLGKVSPLGMKIDSALAFAEALLEEARVAVVPGEDFGDCGQTHIRLSFACSEEQIEKGCSRLNDWIGSLRPATSQMPV